MKTQSKIPLVAEICPGKSKKAGGKLTPLKIREDAAGVDIGATEIYVAVAPDKDAEPVRRFGTFTQDLQQAANWLKSCGVKTVAMESTGVYWIPFFQILEEHGLEVFLVNAQHLKNVPGRKSDVGDSQWIQQLHSMGLLHGSFRPPRQVCALRSILRHRASLTQLASAQILHMQKSLDQMNVQIHHVLSDITGMSGLAMLDAILAGKRDPAALAKLRDGRVKASQATIVKALEGDYLPEHLFTLGQSLAMYRYAQERIGECDREIERRLKEFESQPETSEPAAPGAERTLRKSKRLKPRGEALREQHQRIFGVDITQVDGISTATTETLLGEVGQDLSRFRSASTFASWVGLSPNPEVSGGKVLRTATAKKKSRLALAMRLAANSLLRSQSALGESFRRLRAKLGAPKAITAMAHKLLRIVYHMITTKQPFDQSILQRHQQQSEQRRLKHLQRQAHSLGYQLAPIQQFPATIEI